MRELYQIFGNRFLGKVVTQVVTSSRSALPVTDSVTTLRQKRLPHFMCSSHVLDDEVTGVTEVTALKCMGSPYIIERLLLIFVGHSRSHGQRCIGI